MNNIPKAGPTATPRQHQLHSTNRPTDGQLQPNGVIPMLGGATNNYTSNQQNPTVSMSGTYTRRYQHKQRLHVHYL
ncbi:MAG: hypothetical protein IPM82_21785, partial [Saprospiraceae bacterium]|nr:hypothetical protein [Saprospiraceae bacterium]